MYFVSCVKIKISLESKTYAKFSYLIFFINFVHVVKTAYI